MVRKFLNDKKGGSEAISFLALAMVLMFAFVQFAEFVHLELDNVFLVMSYRKALDQMQIHGGLTAEIETSIKDYLEDYGLKRDNITVSGTVGPVEWGQEVGLEITYTNQYYKYSLPSIISPEKQATDVTLIQSGSTVSYYFDNNS